MNGIRSAQIEGGEKSVGEACGIGVGRRLLRRAWCRRAAGNRHPPGGPCLSGMTMEEPVEKSAPPAANAGAQHGDNPQGQGDRGQAASRKSGIELPGLEFRYPKSFFKLLIIAFAAVALFVLAKALSLPPEIGRAHV